MIKKLLKILCAMTKFEGTLHPINDPDVFRLLEKISTDTANNEELISKV